MSMTYKIEITESAYNDISEAFYYYENISANLGEKFYNDLLQQLHYLESNPNYYGFYTENFRRILLDKFPYLVIYKIVDDKVVLYAVVYGGIDPGTISKKIT